MALYEPIDMVNHYRYTYRNIMKLYRDYKKGKKQIK